jgi:hypothetical protein
MASALAQAHILGELRLRRLVAAAVERIWRELPGHDRENVDEWLSLVLPIVVAAQRQSASLTEAYLARERRRQPLGVDLAGVTGAAVRNGAQPAEVYERPFVTLWGKLGAGTPFADAFSAGLSRATASAATDVQLSMRATASAVGQADPGIYGFERVPDGDACELCLIASTQRYHVEDLAPIHDRCGCTVAPITEPTGQVINRDLYRQLKSEGAMDRITDQRQRAQLRESGIDAVAVRSHGELGPVLTDAAHDFTQL